MELIKSNDASVTFAEPTTAASLVWRNFSCIYVDNQKQNFVSCDTCKDILHHKSIDGTSSMMKHFRSCEKNSINNNNESLTINEYFSSLKTRSVPTRSKKKVLNATVELVAMDNRAFELVGGNGFINLAQTIFDVGQELSKSQNINVSDLLPHPTTVSVSFCGISFHFLNEELQLYAFILGCYPYDRDNQSSSQIRQFVDAKLLEFDLSLENSKFVVTDNENKMKSCFKEPCIRIGCSIHYLNKQLEHCFTSVTLEKISVNCDLVQEMFDYIRKIVSHVRRTHKQSKLPRKLQSYSYTRFNGAFLTMNVFLTVFDDLVGVLDRTFLDDYMLIDKDLLEHVCSFLGPFEEVINELSCDKKPTIYKVLPLRQCLINRCTIHQDDHDGIRQIKTFLSHRFQEVWVMQDIHYITTILHPFLKNFDFNPSLQDKAINLVKNEITKRQSSTSTTSCTMTATTTTTTVTTVDLNTQPKPSASLLLQCFDLPKNDLKTSSKPYQEFDEYMKLNVQINETDDFSLFWLTHKSKFPTLFSIVQDYYAVPAANTTIERLFSSAKNTVTDKRTSLGTEKINKLLFLQKHLTQLKQFDKKIDNVASTTDTKRKVTPHDKNSTEISSHNQEQFRTSTTAKKLKIDQDDDIFICDDDQDDKENDDF
ncbi:unnamed protein product [Rotaria socialis]